MKLKIFILFLLICSVFSYGILRQKKYKIIKVESPNLIYVDFNKNKIAEKNELIEIENFELSDFCIKYSNICIQNLEKLILNKNITIKPKIFVEGKDYEAILVKNNIIKISKDNKNPFLKKYLNILTYKKPKKIKRLSLSENEKNYKFVEFFKIENLKFYFTDYVLKKHPSNSCQTLICKELINSINASKNSIDFAIYGFENQPIIFKTLKKAKERQVKIRCIVDEDRNGKNIYSDTKSLVQEFSCVSDKNSNSASRFMHNKFFIFDKILVFTGSANITMTDLSNFNANNAVFINSKQVANLYEKEFEQMYFGKFHEEKIKTTENENPQKNIIGVYFSPQDKAIVKKIIPLINQAKKYVYVPAFVITQKDFVNALKSASARGVDVKIITDATSATNKYSAHNSLRQAKVQLKVENMAGKIHSKTVIIDDEYVIMGSMNFSKSAENVNDENCIIFKDEKITKYFKNNFLYYWTSIDEKWLKRTPKAESKDSIYSCTDGIDNNFNGLIDIKEPLCLTK